jgi:hypothetical protein
MTCKARPISLEIPRIRSRPDCCNAAIFWELRFLPRFASILRPVRIRRGRAFFSAIFSQGAEMELLKIFFTFWSVTIIALLTLLGIDVIRIWMLDLKDPLILYFAMLSKLFGMGQART